MPKTLSPTEPALCGWPALHGIVFYALFTTATLIPSLRLWPQLWLAPLTAYAILVAVIPSLRATFQPWRFGVVSARTVAATFAIALVSCTALVAFHLLARPDVQSYRHFLPTAALHNLLLAGVVFSIFNALFEEIVFRGILFDAVDSEWGKPAAVIATSALFGYGHLHGYPPGPVGGLLAGIYAVSLGWLRIFTGGIGLPVIAHIAADATIFTLMARSGTI